MRDLTGGEPPAAASALSELRTLRPDFACGRILGDEVARSRVDSPGPALGTVVRRRDQHVEHATAYGVAL